MSFNICICITYKLYTLISLSARRAGCGFPSVDGWIQLKPHRRDRGQGREATTYADASRPQITDNSILGRVAFHQRGH